MQYNFTEKITILLGYIYTSQAPTSLLEVVGRGGLNLKLRLENRRSLGLICK